MNYTPSPVFGTYTGISYIDDTKFSSPFISDHQNDNHEIVHIFPFYILFLWSEKQLIGTKGLEYLLGDSLMVCEGGGVNEDVIHVADGLIAIDEGAEETLSFIIVWKVAGKLHSPKNMTRGSNSPWFVEKAAFHSSPSFSRTLLKPQQRSKVVNHSASRSLVSMSETSGSR